MREQALNKNKITRIALIFAFIFTFIFAMMMVIVADSARVFAANDDIDYTVTSSKANTKYNSVRGTLYQINVTETSYLTITYTTKASDDTSYRLYLTSNLPTESKKFSAVSCMRSITVTPNQTNYYADELKAGTYYLYTKTDNIEFSYKLDSCVRAQSLTSGKTYKIRYDRPILSYKAKEDGYFKVQLSNTDNPTIYGRTYLYMYSDLAMTKYEASVSQTDASSSFEVLLPVAKGTYYFRPYLDRCVDMKITFVSANNKNNYCRAKAISLKAKSQVNIVQTRLNNYTRWYKIKLTKKKSITFTSNSSGYISIVDSKGSTVQIAHDSDNNYYTYNKLAKGTYYVKIYSISTNASSKLITFSWK